MKQKAKLSILCVLSFSLLFLGIGCKSEGEEIKIGAILPMTGPAAQFGQYTKEGIEIGLDELASEAHLPFKLKVLYEDSQGSPKNAVSILNKFLKIDQIDIVFVLTSGETQAIIPIIDKERIVTFTGTILPGVTEKSLYLFRNATSLTHETKYMANFLVNEKNGPTVGIIYVNNDAGKIAKDLFEKEYKKMSGITLIAESYELNATDFRTQLTKIKDKNPEYLYILSYKEFGLVMKQAKELGVESKFIGTTTFEDPSGVKIAGETSNGAIYTVSAFDPDSSSDPILVEFQKKYKEKYGKRAEIYAAIFRDNIKILALALKSNPSNSDELKKTILSLDTFNGASGRTKFLPDGDVDKPIILKVIADGEFKKLEN